jgi:hypothetical protein
MIGDFEKKGVKTYLLTPMLPVNSPTFLSSHLYSVILQCISCTSIYQRRKRKTCFAYRAFNNEAFSSRTGRQHHPTILRYYSMRGISLPLGSAAAAIGGHRVHVFHRLIYIFADCPTTTAKKRLGLRPVWGYQNKSKHVRQLWDIDTTIH